MLMLATVPFASTTMVQKSVAMLLLATVPLGLPGLRRDSSGNVGGFEHVVKHVVGCIEDDADDASCDSDDECCSEKCDKNDHWCGCDRQDLGTQCTSNTDCCSAHCQSQKNICCLSIGECVDPGYACKFHQACCTG